MQEKSWLRRIESLDVLEFAIRAVEPFVVGVGVGVEIDVEWLSSRRGLISARTDTVKTRVDGGR